MQNTWEKAREQGRTEGRTEGRNEGWNEGRLTQARAAVRRVLTLRKLDPSPTEAARIDTCTDLATLENHSRLSMRIDQ